MLNQRFSVILVATVAAMTVASVVLTYGLLFGSRTIPSQGNVDSVGVGVYWDASCTSEVTAIDWGFLEPGALGTATVYVRNNGTLPMALNITTGNWSPDLAASHIALSWDCEGTVVGVQAIVPAVLTLSVSSSISDVTSFSFDIIITGTE